MRSDGQTWEEPGFVLSDADNAGKLKHSLGVPLAAVASWGYINQTKLNLPTGWCDLIKAVPLLTVTCADKPIASRQDHGF